MKKLLYFIITAACAASSFTSCKMMEDDIFDTDPATRQDNWMAEYRRVFNNNDHGWALYASSPTYGRHPSVGVYAVKFEQEYCTFFQSSATVRIPNMWDKESMTSTYSFKMDNGIVLSFDTYNSFFHYYADQSQYFSQDLQAEFEFCLDRYSENEDTIFGHGKTKGLPFFMVKMKTDPQEYQKLSDEIDNYAVYDCLLTVAGDSLPTKFYSGYHNLSVFFPDEEGGEPVEHMYSYGPLVNGIYMMENFVYKDRVVVEFTLNREDGTFEDKVGTSGAKIVGLPLSDYLLAKADYDTWFFGYSGLGSYTKGEWDKMKETLDASGNFQSDWLHNITFDCDGKGGVTLIVNMWYAEQINYPMEVKRISDDEIAIRWTGEENCSCAFSFYDSGMKYLVEALAKKDSWTHYKVTHREGNAMSPVGFELIQVDNPANSIFFETNFRYYHDSIWD
ncbi:MAG: DUF4302 domain-containing protein [Muribaculaceae bacterium]|nr:DUF4302 domain-containing protein [Muribaculaceae bacterium]